MSEYFAAADLSGLPPEGLAVVGFSGGADSTALAHWLCEKIGPRRVVLAHVNHLLRGEEADRDQATAEAFARQLGVRFALLRADVGALARQRGMGLEACGRQVRYQFFHSLAPGEADRILTAHNAQDNAETMLLHLCRGTGLAGLCGIPPRRGKVLRPFLGVDRREIESYCAEKGLSYVTDSTNLTGDFARNRLRREVLPLLEELNPRFVQGAGQAAALLRRDRDFLESQAAALLNQARLPWGLEARLLRAAHPSLQARALARYLEEAGCRDLEKKHLDLAATLLETGGGLSLPGGVAAQCRQGVFYAWRPAPGGPFQVEVGLGENLLPDGRVLILRRKSQESGAQGQKIHNSFFKNALDYAIITGHLKPGSPLTARTRLPGDRFAPAGRGAEKSLNRLLQEYRVPQPCRERLVLLACGGQLLYCEGLGPAQGFGAAAGGELLTVELRERER